MKHASPLHDDVLAALVTAALSLASKQAWETITLADLARASGLDLTELYELGGRDTLIAALNKRLDLAMAEAIPGPDASVRDRLFDCLMARFDAREANRAGYLSVLTYQDRSLAEKARGFALNQRSARWALSLAGVEGRFAEAASVPLARLIGRVDEAWMLETTPDLGRVMATLDRGLRDMEDTLSQIRRWTKGFKSGSA
jgi:hypothetical protein